jgi:HAMP domain-containing protein
MIASRSAVWLSAVSLVVAVLILAGLAASLFVVSGRLKHMSDAMRELAASSIETTITVRQTMPLDAEIRIAKATDIDLDLDVNDRLPIRLDVQVKETIAVPLDLQIEEEIAIESAVHIPKKSNIRVKADIGVDQPVRWRVANPIIPLLNIKGNVPVDQDVEITFPETLQIKGKIPVKFRLTEQIDVPIEFSVPVEQMLDLKLAIEQRARVGFPEPLNIVGEIPIVMEIPVRVPLQPTPVGIYLEKMAGQIDGLFGW